MESQEYTIQNQDEFKTALENYWVNITQIKEVKDEIKKEKKQRMQAVEMMVKEINHLTPAIEQYMLQHKISHAVKFRGKTFRLRWTNHKSKIDLTEASDMMRERGLDESTMSIISDALSTKKECKRCKIECKLAEVTDIDE